MNEDGDVGFWRSRLLDHLRSGQTEAEDRPLIEGATTGCDAVKLAGAALHQFCHGIRAIGSVKYN